MERKDSPSQADPWQGRIAACKALLGLTLELEERLKSGEPEALAEIVESRGDLMTRIDGEAGRKPRPDQGPSAPAALGQGGAAPEEMVGILRLLAEADGRCLALAKDRVETLRREIAGISRREKGVQGYGRRKTDPRFLSVRL